MDNEAEHRSIQLNLPTQGSASEDLRKRAKISGVGQVLTLAPALQ